MIFLGSASGMLFANRSAVRTTVYTLTKCDDKGNPDRNEVNLDRLHELADFPTKRRSSVEKDRHIKCDLKDYHYDHRFEECEKQMPDSYQQLVDYYVKNYDEQFPDDAANLRRIISQAITEFSEISAK